MIYGYVRVSTQEQSVEGQKNLISRYSIEHKLIVDEWIAVEMSSKKSQEARRINELLNGVVSPNPPFFRYSINSTRDNNFI